jgi:hypothetical protein
VVLEKDVWVCLVLQHGSARVWVEEADAEPRSAELTPAPEVIDAGFDEWVRAQWSTLLKGEPVPMAFLVPSRLRSYGFKVRAMTPVSPTVQSFRLRLSGWLGWLAPSIEVSYATADQRLLRFTGPSNIRDDRGESPLVVDIRFDEMLKAAPSGLWEQLEAEPLTKCSVGL